MIKGKSPEEIRKTFNIKNDFTPAEEEQVYFIIFQISLGGKNILKFGLKMFYVIRIP